MVIPSSFEGIIEGVSKKTDFHSFIVNEEKLQN